MLSEKAKALGERKAHPSGGWVTDGMTVRVEFAKAAMQGMAHYAEPDYSRGHSNKAIVERAFVLADAMLEFMAKEADHAE